MNQVKQIDTFNNSPLGVGGVKIAYNNIYAHPLPEGHRFPMLKYELIPAQLLHEGSITEANLFSPNICDSETILLTHDAAYLDKLMQQTLTASEQRKIGFPQSPMLTQRELMITQGTIDCCHYAFKNGVALNVAGGTHHAFADRGEGFCMLNDMAVASNYLLHHQLAKQILIIDLDVHQGNGTAKLFENNPSVFTFSMHGLYNYPFHKEKSYLDVGLTDGCDTDTYLNLLDKHLTELIATVQPDFAFYLSGVDILETDKFGKLKVTIDGCRQRDAYVFNTLHQHQIPVVVAMGGGYSPDVKVIVEAHCNTYREAIKIYG
jgi:acetoin utilization deacetylase AcuC-like enzyme